MVRLVLLVAAFSVLGSCSTLKSMYSGERYDSDRPQRAAWVRKTSRWLTVYRRLHLYKKSPRFSRMKKILKRFNIKQLYVFSGRSQASYVGYRSQGLFKLCHQFRRDGFVPWANFRQDRRYKKTAKVGELKILLKRFQRDNRKNNNCFEGIHFDIEERTLAKSELRQIQDTFEKIRMPVSLNSHSRNLRKLSKYLKDATIMRGSGKPLKLSRKIASASHVYPRQNLDLTAEKMKKLSLDDVENQLVKMEKRAVKSMGAAIFTLEHLIFKYDREDPPMRIVQ